MSLPTLTERQLRYLDKFRRQRKRWDFYSSDSDFARLRRVEKAYYGLFIFFTCSSRTWIEGFFDGLWSWTFITTVLISCWVAYMVYDLFRVSALIDVLLELGTEEVTALLENAEQADAPKSQSTEHDIQ